jgi:acyl carrier protein
MGCEAENVTPSASLRDDLGLDSLDVVELAITLEESLGIEEIMDSDIDDAATVGDVAKMLTRKNVVDPSALKRALAEIEKARGAEAALAKRVEKEKLARQAEKKEKTDATKAMASGAGA